MKLQKRMKIIFPSKNEISTLSLSFGLLKISALTAFYILYKVRKIKKEEVKCRKISGFFIMSFFSE